MSFAGNIRVALVDDDESLCRSLERVLRALGIHTVFFHSAEQFIANSGRAHFDCLLLDIQLNGISGIELNRHLAAARSTVPVIFITAHNQPNIREQALQTPCVNYLLKSDPAEVVVSAIRSATAGKPVGANSSHRLKPDVDRLQNQPQVHHQHHQHNKQESTT